MPKLLIVESPAKAKTIATYLGPGWAVRASYGHIRDLPQRELGVSVDDGFGADYQPLESKVKVVQALRDAAHGASEIFLATDYDREGEAIAWHVAELLGIPESQRQRITFTEITKSAITAAIAQPRQLDIDLVDAQQTRRILDRLVGYTLSPLLSEWLRGRMSAGRVQSAGLKIIVDRERAIQAFTPLTFYRVRGLVRPAEVQGEFWAGLVSVNGEKVDPQSIVEKSEADRIAEEIKGGRATIGEVTADEVDRSPAPPFVTSSLQQEASRKLGMSPAKTMEIAQVLYQGVETKDGPVGLITYMRTDSVNLAPEAVDAIRTFITDVYPEAYLSKEPRSFKAKTKGAQEAHEAIRPTNVGITPEQARAFLDADQVALYELIWRRAVATQMSAARYATMTVGVEVMARGEAGSETLYGLEARGRRQVFDGFLTLYEEDEDEPEAGESKDGKAGEEVEQLPAVTRGMGAGITESEAAKSQTRAPIRFTEASFIKELEKRGIGRPSTYAATVSTLKDRGYVVVEKKKLVPTDLGMTLTGVMEDHFAEIADSEFTAGMEERLDAIAEGGADWREFLGEFWGGFSTHVEERRGSVVAEDVLGKVEYPCPQCGSDLQTRFGRNGKFVACTAYPECKYAVGSEAKRTDETCPQCARGMLTERSKGEYTYLSCELYPECRYIRGAGDVVTDQRCPKCERGRVLERASRPKKGSRQKKTAGATKTYLVCELRPECDWLSDPSVVATDETCPQCGEAVLEQREGEYGAYLACGRRREGCKYLRQVTDVLLDETCPECQKGRLVEREGKHGKFVCCELRPTCEYIKRDKPAAVGTGVTCGKCGKGEMMERVGKKGTFWGCSAYPKCKNTLDQRPMPVKCAECGGMVIQTATQAQCADCGRAA